MIWTEYQVAELNEVIEKCIEHGGDYGGAYFSYPKSCYNTINNFLIAMNAENVKVVETKEYPYIKVVLDK